MRRCGIRDQKRELSRATLSSMKRVNWVVRSLEGQDIEIVLIQVGARSYRAERLAIAARRLRARFSPAGRPVVQASPTGQGTTVVVYRPASGARERDLDSLEGCAVAHVAGGQ